MQPVLAKSRPRLSVLDLDRNAFIAQLASLLKAKKVDRAYIVGSYARQEAQLWSDVDLLIIHETDLPFIERPRFFADLCDLEIPFDILVYTPNEFAILEHDPTGFWRDTQRDRLQIA